MAGDPTITSLGRGAFLVVTGDEQHVVYVAGPPSNRWAFWNGRVFHSTTDEDTRGTAGAHAHAAQTLIAPMPATVIRVLVAPGAPVTRGTPVVVLEAMKMELPVRAPADGTVKAVHCKEGELVQADQLLVEFE